MIIGTLLFYIVFVLTDDKTKKKKCQYLFMFAFKLLTNFKMFRIKFLQVIDC